MAFRFDNLDSIRTIAFLSTFMAHGFYSESPEILNHEVFKGVIKFNELFSFGVPIFFVLSGFLITYLMFREVEKNNRFSIKNFYIRRILRIWPVYYLVLVIGFIIFPIVRSALIGPEYPETANPWYYTFFLSNIDQIQASTLPFGIGLGPTWSVSVEEQFYLIWPLIFVLLPKKNFLWGILLIITSSIFLSSFFELSNKNLIYCISYLGIGALAAYIAYHYEGFVRKITNISVFTLLPVFLLLLLTIYTSLYIYSSFLFIPIIAILISYIILQQCYGTKGALKKIPLLERMGKYTYGLYLYHVICNFVVYTLFVTILKFDESIWMAVVFRPIISLILSAIVSIFSYRYMESYFLRLKEHFSKQ